MELWDPNRRRTIVSLVPLDWRSGLNIRPVFLASRQAHDTLIPTRGLVIAASSVRLPLANLFLILKTQCLKKLHHFNASIFKLDSHDLRIRIERALANLIRFRIRSILNAHVVSSGNGSFHANNTWVSAAARYLVKLFLTVCLR